MFRFAHISDLHLAPLPPVQPWQLCNKRILGYLSWYRKRKKLHCAKVVAALTRDLKNLSPDHICITGDLVNIALPAEFENAAIWMENLSPPAQISLVPGNHDAYVGAGLPLMTRCWSRWMGSGFPYIHSCGPVNFIGLSTAIPTAPFMASGRLGARQLEKLEEILIRLGRQGQSRIILLHHPPQAKACRWRKSLLDAASFRAIIARAGANMILHGHLHRPIFTHIEGPHGPVPVFGAGSASLYNADPSYAGHYRVFEYDVGAVTVLDRSYDSKTDSFIESGRECLTIGPSTPLISMN